MTAEAREEPRVGPAARPVVAMIEQLSRELRARIAGALEATIEPEVTPAARRGSRLEHLAEMVLEREAERSRSAATEARRPRRSGKLVDRKEYDRGRPTGALSSRALVNEFGSWRDACQAALSWTRSDQAGIRSPGRRPWASSTRGRRRPPTYTRAEVLAAVRLCADALGRDPLELSSHAYYTWAARQRRLARRRGAEPPRLPAQRSVERHFPNGWATVREALE